MNFEPVRVLKSVLDFYVSSGIVDPDPELVRIETYSGTSLDGDRQKYEQINLFVFGHLLPDYAPLVITTALRDKVLRTSFQLPPASNSAYHNLFDDLSQDIRLDKLNQSCGSRLRTSLEPPAIMLDFPVSATGSDGNTAPTDLEELRRRFETLTIAATLFDGYIQNGKRHMTLMERAIEDSDWDEALRHVHALKGGALNLCAVSLSEACRQLELAVKHRELSDAPDMVREINRQFARLSEYYQDHKESFHG